MVSRTPWSRLPIAPCVSHVQMFGGFVKRYAHQSSQLGCKMNFSLFVPPAAADGGKVPVGRDMLVTGADAGP